MKLCLWIYQGTPSNQPVPWNPHRKFAQKLPQLICHHQFYSCLFVCLFGSIMAFLKVLLVSLLFQFWLIHFKKCLMPGIFLGIFWSWWMVLKVSGHFTAFHFTRFFSFVLSSRCFWGVLLMQVLRGFERRSQVYNFRPRMIFWSCIFSMYFAF